ncbi:MAG: FkbM family methyltransferase [Syntrophobacteraceae bacterium]
MNNVVQHIVDLVNSAPKDMDILNWLFQNNTDSVVNGRPIVLYGTGSLGKDILMTLRNCGIHPVCYCNSDPSRCGGEYCGLPVISLDELIATHRNSCIVITTQTYAASVIKNLIDYGFDRKLIIWNKMFDMATSLYFSFTNQSNLASLRSRPSHALIDSLIQNEKKVSTVYTLLADQKSRDLFISKLTLLVANHNIKLFTDYLMSFSEPIATFGLIPFPVLGPENFFYFTNDVLALQQGETYLDVGAFDGDSVLEFVKACRNQNVTYNHIFAFEPDPKNFDELEKNSIELDNISCHRLGVFSQSGILRFESSDIAVAPTASGISDGGDIEIKVISVDEFLDGRKITLLKMDPPGNIIPKALIGSHKTINAFRPRLVLGAYHSFEAIFDVPMMVHDILPEYNLYLRHLSWTICETDLFAIN